jgi:hypothetical protein
MSFLNGDRARAHKVGRKRRFRRSELRLLRRGSAPALEVGVEAASAAEPIVTPRNPPDDSAPATF